MQKGFELRGVPHGLERDGWWLSAPDEAAGAAPPPQVRRIATGGISGGALGLISLLILGDFLFWGQSTGLSLALFVLALVLVAGHGRAWPQRMKALAVSAVGAAPVVDYIQPLSVSFLIAGLILALALLAGPGGRPLPLRVADFLLELPERWLLVPRLLHLLAPGRGGLQLTRNTAGHFSQPASRNSLLRDWAVPVGGSLIFLSLILGANPALLQIGSEMFNPIKLLQRVLFWIGLALLILPFLMRDAAAVAPDLSSDGLRFRLPGLNPRSVLRALILFNLLIGVQMISDIAILIGGAELPRGVTASDYARRGAWPLLATAMLAGAFTLAARPFTYEHRLIRPLLLVWLLQNILLTGAAALRLDLYIDRFGLTFLRLYALIWIGLVAFGLGLMAWQSLTARSNSWLISRLLIAAVSVLYIASFVNFSALVAERNLARAQPDYRYICELGPMAASALRTSSEWIYQSGYRHQNCAAASRPVIHGWRDWGFRSARVLRNLDAAKAAQLRGDQAG
ncbi:DUF4153 domain-containing protein [Pseudogemmobacter bohemicus]|uniref:DUF4153 domain-containing protein n=1 Tax=Pseudogemmobacter bohemicus TaxID=2250708 RepID=UPI000DD33430|nr:DUF4173 domain-containing protein [Pseudogemmobacter bohemicus]